MPLRFDSKLSLASIFSNALNVEIKKLMKQIITTPVNSNISKFFIYFLSFKLKKINNPRIVGGQRPINTAFSKFSSTK
jgi:hypothetical protein